MKFRSIGDVLLTTPLIRNLKLHYPEAQIDVAVNAEAKAVLEENPDVKTVLPYDRKAIKSGGFWNRLKGEAAFAKVIKDGRYDMVINMTEGDRGAFLALWSGAKTRVGIPPKNRLLKNAYTHTFSKQEHLHTVEWGLKALEALGLEPKEKKVYAFSGEAAQAKVDTLELPEIFVHVHPLSRWQFKCIDDTKMAAMIDFLESEMGVRCVITAAADAKELDRVDNILSLCTSKSLSLAGQLNLKEVIALNAKAKFFLGVDTAIMHIAAANDTPVLAFFGPSGAFHWGPWDNDLSTCGYVNHNGIQSMGKHTVYQVDWDCAPCGQDGCDGSKISQCLIKGVDMEKVKTLLREKL